MMQLQSLGYVGIRTGDVDQWATYATRFLGMQMVDRSRGALAFRMDDRKQRVIVNAESGEGVGFYGWEVADAAALDSLAAHLEKSGVAIARGSRALADERRVKELIVSAIRPAIGWKLSTAPSSRASRSSPAARFPVFAPARSAWGMRC